MLIIAIEATADGQHYFESQSHRTEVWLEGYAEVPSEREAEVVGCGVVIEKSFQEGADRIRNLGYCLESLCAVQQLNPVTGEVVFK